MRLLDQIPAEVLQSALRRRQSRRALPIPHPEQDSPLAVGSCVRRTDGTGQCGYVIKIRPEHEIRRFLVCFRYGNSAWLGRLELEPAAEAGQG